MKAKIDFSEKRVEILENNVKIDTYENRVEKLMSIIETILDIPAEHTRNVFGEFDSFIKKIEKTFNVTVIVRDNAIKIIGDDSPVRKARKVFLDLIALSEKGEVLTEQQVNYAMALAFDDKETSILSLSEDIICHTANGKPVRAKTLGQKKYIDAIQNNTITFGIGPAGTGKTYLAMAMAITAFKNNEVSRIILTRPAIEAGEKLGFLPGDLQSKIDPYLRPLYDALYEIMGADSYIRNSEKGLIEVAPLAYMRGRTLDNSYIVLDEAQNTTPAQMKMFLTRVGFGSKVVITGDLSQKDLPKDAVSGLDTALKVLKGIDEIGVCMLTAQDVVRHPLVQKIVEAYEKYEKRQTGRSKRQRPGKGA